MSLLEPLPSFVTLRDAETEGSFRLTVDNGVVAGPAGEAALFGGVGLAAGVASLERISGRPAVWAAGQYLSFASPPAELSVRPAIVAQGHYTSQGRAVICDGEREIVSVAASLGARPEASRRQWVQPPDVPRPEACDAMPIWWDRLPDDMHGRFELKVARGWHVEGEADDGRATLWVRAREAVAIDRPFLSVIGDFMPSALGYATGQLKMSSLDNSIRFLCLAPTEWVLCDIRLYGIAGGFGHGRVLMFADDGTLLAIAGQSVILREWQGKAAG